MPLQDVDDMAEDRYVKCYKELVDKGIMKKMQKLLGTEDELKELAEINIELNHMLKEKEKEHQRIEYMARIVRRRIDSVRDERASRKMVKKGYYIEGE